MFVKAEIYGKGVKAIAIPRTAIRGENTVFPEPASYPFLDALTTVMSFVAMWLLVRKHIESWCYWIVVDVIGIWLYFVKDVKFIALLYVLLLGLAIIGLRNWHRAGRNPDVAEDT